MPYPTAPKPYPTPPRRPQCCAGPINGPVETGHDPRHYQFLLPRAHRPAITALPERWYPSARTIARAVTSTRRAGHPAGVRAIVIHATAGASSAGAFSVMREGRASFHWLVPHPSEAAHDAPGGGWVWATAPESRAAWHVANAKSHPDVLGGARHLNHASLGIEIVNRQDGRDPFSRWQVEMTALIVRYAWAKYPNLETVVSHAKLDPGRRSDPGSTFPWETFRALTLA